MKHAGRNTEGLERAQAADAEQQFLADSDAQIAAVEARGEFAIFRSIAFDVGIEQQQIAAADFNAPDFGSDACRCGFRFRRRRGVRLCRWRLPSATE